MEHTSWEDWFFESPTAPGFTGVDVFERMAATYAYSWGDPVIVWQIAYEGWDDLSAPEVMADPYFRDVFLQPSWKTSGWAEGVTESGLQLAYMNLSFLFPSGTHIYKPIVYPRDGQEDVPTTGRSLVGEGDPLSGARGFPITATVGASDAVGGINPYLIVVLSSTLTDSAGADVPMLVLTPDTSTFGSLTSTAVFKPHDPLEPGTTYTFEAEISWIDRKKTVTSTFTTAADPPSAVRRVPHIRTRRTLLVPPMGG